MKIGDKWNEWTVESRIGAGSYGKVYKIVRKDSWLSIESALKVISVPQNEAEIETLRNEGLDDDDITAYYRSMVEDIVSEFVIMSELKGNSNIVSYEDHYYEEKTDSLGWDIYIRMELLTPLLEYMNTRTFTTKDAIQLGIDMCKALELCRNFNIIHRDIKPENIFVSKFGDFKLGDFGIAKQLEDASSAGTKKGTIAYMAPEIVHHRSYNSSVDIYSLGIVLYRIFNNQRLPFMPPPPQEILYSDRERALRRRLDGEPLPLPCLAEGKIGDVILKACAYDPKDRYESPRAMREELEAILREGYEGIIVDPKAGSKEAKQAKTTDQATEVEPAPEQEAEPAPIVDVEPEPAPIEEAEPAPIIEAEPEQVTEVEPAPKQEAEPAPEPIIEAEPEVASELTIVAEPEVAPEPELAPELTIVAEPEEASEPEPTPEPIVEVEPEIVPEPIVEAEPAPVVRPKPKAPAWKMIVPALVILILIAGGLGIYKYYHHVVPDVVGMDEEEARQAITLAGLTSSETREFSDSIDRGIIIEQTNQGEALKKNSEIALTVSAGKPVKVPDFTGYTEKEAAAKAKKLGLTIAVDGKELSDNIPKGGVTGQKPKAGKKCEVETEVKLIISKGIIQVEVPGVVGETEDDAADKLQKAGLEYSAEYLYSSETAGIVIAQSVEEGSSVDKHSTITITVSAGPAPAPKKSSSSKKSSKKSSGSSSSGDWDVGF